jgi:hypothetical protein
METTQEVKPKKKTVRNLKEKNKQKPPKAPKKSKKRAPKKEKVDGRKKVNRWMKHVMEYRKEHPEVAYRDVLKKAKETYKKD